jgi:SH3-like domain-containing protein
MAEFYGRVQGNRGEVHRMGTAASGIETTAESWGSIVHAKMQTASAVSGHRSRIKVTAKNGNIVMTFSLDTDSLVDYKDEPQVMAKIREAEEAMNRLDREVAEAAERAMRNR